MSKARMTADFAITRVDYGREEGMAGWCASFIRVSESPQRSGSFLTVGMKIVQTAHCS